MLWKQAVRMLIYHRSVLFGFMAVAIMLLSSSYIKAADRYWNVSSGDWSTASNWGGTEPTSSDDAYIQNGGTATITQTGESCKYLYLGATNSGTVKITGGSLSVSNYSYVGYTGTGTFTQTGGTNTATHIKIGTAGTYTLTGGTLNINGGFENQGIWDLSNSSAVINASSSIVNLSGSILATAGNASFNLDAHSLLIVPSGFDPANYFTTYTNAGILHQAGSALDISSAYSIYGIGSINDHVNCQGTISATSSGYSINLNGGLTVSGTGSVNLRSGTLYVKDTSSAMSGGSLSANYQYVGTTGTQCHKRLIDLQRIEVHVD